MKININLGAGAFVPLHDVITAPDAVCLSVSSAIYPIKDVVLTVRKGTEEKQYRASEYVDITPYCQSAGRVDISAALIVNGKAAKVWTFEPLIVTEVSGVFEPIPQLVAMESEIAAMKGEINTLKAALVELKNITT